MVVRCVQCEGDIHLDDSSPKSEGRCPHCALTYRLLFDDDGDIAQVEFDNEETGGQFRRCSQCEVYFKDDGHSAIPVCPQCAGQTSSERSLSTSSVSAKIPLTNSHDFSKQPTRGASQTFSSIELDVNPYAAQQPQEQIRAPRQTHFREPVGSRPGAGARTLLRQFLMMCLVAAVLGGAVYAVLPFIGGNKGEELSEELREEHRATLVAILSDMKRDFPAKRGTLKRLLRKGDAFLNHFRESSYREAVSYLSQAANQAPENMKAVGLLAEALYFVADHENSRRLRNHANKLTSIALVLGATDVEIYRAKLASMYASGNFDGLQREIVTLKGSLPAEGDDYRVDIYHRSADLNNEALPEGVENALKSMLQEWGARSVQVYDLLAQYYVRKGRMAEARAALTQRRQLDGGSAGTLELSGMVEELFGKKERARTAYETVLRRAPAANRARLRLATLLYRLNRRNESLRHFMLIGSRYRRDANSRELHLAHLWLCGIYLVAKRNGDAQKYCALAYESRSYSTAAKEGQAYLHYAQGQFEQARAVVDEGLRIKPKNQRLIYAKAMILKSMNSEIDAIKLLRNLVDNGGRDGLRFEPITPHLFMTLAALYDGQGQFDEAQRVIVQSFDRGWRSDPHRYYRSPLLVTYLEPSPWLALAAGPAVLLRKHPKSAAMWALAGEGQRFNGNQNKAAEYYRGALSLRPHWSGVQIFYADLLLSQKQFKRAKQLFQKFPEPDTLSPFGRLVVARTLRTNGEVGQGEDYLPDVDALREQAIRCLAIYEGAQFQLGKGGNIDPNSIDGMRVCAAQPLFSKPVIALLAQRGTQQTTGG